MENKQFSALAVENTIHIHYGSDAINIQKENNPELFEKIFNMIVKQEVNELQKRFFEFKEELEKYTQGNFYFNGNKLFLKGDSEEIPGLLAKKLTEAKDAGADFMPLIRFWKKLKQNPDERIKTQLYGFMTHNNIPITELGDVICEKGVDELENGKLVDCYTKTIDNTIGMVVRIPRDKVDADPNKTCSHGLHVGAPDYVRNIWSSGLIVEVLVDPKDFVSIPIDYNNTKARVCKYKVIGLAKKENTKKLIYDFDDIVVPTFGNMEEQKKRDKFNGTAVDHSKKPADEIDFTKMTAKAIIEYVEKQIGEKITLSLKNKKAIIAKAKKMLNELKSNLFDASSQSFDAHLSKTQEQLQQKLDDANKKYEEVRKKMKECIDPIHKQQLSSEVDKAESDILDIMTEIRKTKSKK